MEFLKDHRDSEVLDNAQELLTCSVCLEYMQSPIFQVCFFIQILKPFLIFNNYSLSITTLQLKTRI